LKAIADECFDEAMQLLDKTLGKDHPHTKTVRDNLQRLQARLHGQVQVLVKAILPQ